MKGKDRYRFISQKITPSKLYGVSILSIFEKKIEWKQNAYLIRLSHHVPLDLSATQTSNCPNPLYAMGVMQHYVHI